MDNARREFSRVRDRVRRFCSQDVLRAPIELLRRSLPAATEFYIAGGALRNIAITHYHGGSPPTKDIDLFLGNLDQRSDLAAVLRGQRIARTDLGGIRWFPSNSIYAFDISRLADFLIIKKYKLEPTRANLLQSIDFDVNAIVYDYNNQELFEQRCLTAVAAQKMQFNTLFFVDKALLAFRALNIRHKIDFVFGEDIFGFLKWALDIHTLIQVKAIMTQKLGKARTKAVLQDLNRLSSRPDYQAYRHAFHR
jgi:hypothetical protein